MPFAMESLSSSSTDLLAAVDANLACGAICIARIHCDHAHASATAGQVLAAYDDGRSDDAIAGEHRSRAGCSICDGNRKISLAARFDTGLYGGKTKAKRQCFRRDEG